MGQEECILQLQDTERQFEDKLFYTQYLPSPWLSPVFPAPLLPTTALSHSTKQMLADLIQFHPGDTLEEILSLSAPREQVSGWPAHTLSHHPCTADSLAICYSRPGLYRKESCGGRATALTPAVSVHPGFNAMALPPS